MAAVMLVEDEAFVRERLPEMLREQGLPVHDAGDGDAAISLLAHARPEVPITDINLGDGPDGFEVSRRAPALTIFNRPLRIRGAAAAPLYWQVKLTRRDEA